VCRRVVCTASHPPQGASLPSLVPRDWYLQDWHHTQALQTRSVRTTRGGSVTAEEKQTAKQRSWRTSYQVWWGMWGN
jgi:hypothetical protein